MAGSVAHGSIEFASSGRRAPATRVNGAVLLPDVKDYPKDKIEIIAPMRLKEAFGVEDGDQLTLEFGN